MKKHLITCVLFLYGSLIFAQKAFDFGPVWFQVNFSKRDKPAMLTNESDESLSKEGFVYIGSLYYTITGETYWAKDTKSLPSTTCERKSIMSFSGNEFASKAASFGGDLVKMDSGKLFDEEVSKNSNKCLRTIRVQVEVAYGVNDHGLTEYRSEYRDRCVQWEQIIGVKCKIQNTGKIYRKKDPEISELMQLDEKIDQFLNTKENLGSSKIKRKSEDEFNSYINQFGARDKYYAVNRWVNYFDKLRIYSYLQEDRDTTEGKIVLSKFKRYGHYDNDGNFVADNSIIYASDFQEGLGCSQYNTYLGPGKYGFIDHNGNWVIAPVYDFPAFFVSGVASVIYKGERGYIDKKGKLYLANEIIDPIKLSASLLRKEADYKLISIEDAAFYDSISNLNQKDQYNAMDKRFTKLYLTLNGMGDSDPMTIVWANQDNTVKLTIDPNLSKCKTCLCGYADTSGKVIIEPKFTNCKYFYQGLASVSIGEGKKMRWGYIDLNGNWVIKTIYEFAGCFLGGVAGVRIDGKQAYIDKTGKLYKK